MFGAKDSQESEVTKLKLKLNELIRSHNEETELLKQQIETLKHGIDAVSDHHKFQSERTADTFVSYINRQAIEQEDIHVRIKRLEQVMDALKAVLVLKSS